jgi:hypothetical protein
MLEIVHPTGLFALDLPPGWGWHNEPDGGAAVPPGAPGALVISAQAVEDPTRLPNVSRMLAGFLTLRGRPVAADALTSIQADGSQGVSYRYTEGEHFWQLWVVGNQATWALLSYNCPAEFQDSHRPALETIVASLRLSVLEDM